MTVKVRDKKTGLIAEFDTKPTKSQARAKFESMMGKTNSPMQRFLQGRGTPQDITQTPTAEPPAGQTLQADIPERLPTPQEANFPRFSQAPTLPRKVAGLAADLSSYPGRRMMTAMEPHPESHQYTPEQSKQFEEDRRRRMAQTRGEGILEQIAISPKTLPAVASLPVGGWLGGLTKSTKLAPIISGGIEGLVSGGMGQTERYAETGQVDKEEFTKEVLANTFLNTVAPIFAGTLRSTGTGIFRQSAKQLTNETAIKKGAKLENLFKNKVAGGMHSSVIKVENRIEELGNKLTDLVQNKKGTIDLMGVLESAKNDFFNPEAQEFILKEYADIAEEIGPQLAKWEKRLELTGPQASWKEVLDFKRAVGRAGKFVHEAKTDQKAQELVANVIYDHLRQKLAEGIPETVLINRQLSELIPLREPLKRAARQLDRNYKAGLQELLAVIAGSNIGGQVFGATGAMAGILPGMLMGGIRASKSPAFGAFLRRAGDSPVTNLLSQGVMQPVKRGVSEQYGVTDEEIKEQAIQRALSGGR